jgi:hypothetical protein
MTCRTVYGGKTEASISTIQAPYSPSIRLSELHCLSLPYILNLHFRVVVMRSSKLVKGKK